MIKEQRVENRPLLATRGKKRYYCNNEKNLHKQFILFPNKLAPAITAHKIQGITDLDCENLNENRIRTMKLKMCKVVSILLCAICKTAFIHLVLGRNMTD